MDTEVQVGNEVRHHSPVGLAQALVGDEVLEAGWFVPNVRGRRGLSSLAGVRDRRRLRARGSDLGGRRLLALTARHLHVLRPWAWLIGRSEAARYRRSEIFTRPVEVVGSPDLVAIELVDRPNRWPLAEARPLDEGALRLMAVLLRLHQTNRNDEVER